MSRPHSSPDIVNKLPERSWVKCCILMLLSEAEVHMGRNLIVILAGAVQRINEALKSDADCLAGQMGTGALQHSGATACRPQTAPSRPGGIFPSLRHVNFIHLSTVNMVLRPSRLVTKLFV